MPKYKDENVNQVDAEGRIVSIRPRKDGITSVMTIISKNGRDIFPRFICPSKEISGYKIHDRVQIKGHIHTYPLVVDKKYRMQQEFIADSIIPAETLSDQVFGVKGKFFAQMKCDVYVKGIVASVKTDGEWYRYTVEVPSDQKNGYADKIYMSMKKIDRHPVINKGDTICSICGVSTPVKTIDDKNKYFEDLIVSDIAIVTKGAFAE